MMYVLEKSTFVKKQVSNPMVIFCIGKNYFVELLFLILVNKDTSGSIGHTLKVEGGVQVDKRIDESVKFDYMSRLQCVETAVHSQLSTLREESPNCVAVIIEFSSNVVVLG
jgi:hypothetical protein